MFDYEYALNRAKDYLEDSEIPLQITSEGEFAEGWFFCYQSAEYLRTGDSSDQLAGNSPFLTDRNTGELIELGTAKPIAAYIADYLHEHYAP
ncbi:YrhB domain-containing protein [Pseudomonas sp.]|jgi:hypothetical protein|uniref:YrhB domain-containing protein n=1 Tax=Pseudomonas sp. TaxID=306 RepID=UPI002EDB4E48